MKKCIAVWMLIWAGSTFGQMTTGDVIGTVYFPGKKEVIVGAKAVIEDNGRKYQAISNDDGRFRIPQVPSGKYELRIYYAGDTMKNISADVPIEAYCQLGDIEFSANVKIIKEVVVKAQVVKLVMGELPIKELSSKDIVKSPIKFDLKTLASSMSSDIHMSDDGELSFRGSRKGDMIYVIDGIKCPEVFNVPSCSISKMMVYTGGLPAKYGDTLGGAIVVETKGYFELLRAYNAQNGE